MAEDCRAPTEDVEELSTSMDEGESDGDVEDGDGGGDGDGDVEDGGDGGDDSGEVELDVVDPRVTGVGLDNATGTDVKFTQVLLMGIGAAVPGTMGTAVVDTGGCSDVTEDVEVITLLTDTGEAVGTVDMKEVDSFLCQRSVL